MSQGYTQPDNEKKFKSLKELGVPWHYRFRFTNWLMAHPWRIAQLSPRNYGYQYQNIYKSLRNESRNPFTGKLYHEGYGRLKSLWLTITFPYVHHEKEE